MNNRSRIPGQEGRLSELAQRVQSDAQGVLRGYRERGEWVEPFVQLAPWLITAAAAGLAALLFIPPLPTPGLEAPSIVEQSIGPTDPMGALFALASQPPSGLTFLVLEEQ